MKKKIIYVLASSISCLFLSSYTMEQENPSKKPYTPSETHNYIQQLPKDVLALILTHVITKPILEQAVDQIKTLKLVNKKFKEVTETVPFIVSISALIEEYAKKFHLPPSAIVKRLLRKLQLTDVQKDYLFKKYSVLYPPNKSLDQDLLDAIDSLDMEKIQELIKAGADVNAKDSDGRTALIKTSKAGHKDIIEFLLQAGADVNAKDSDGGTALMTAVFVWQKEAVELLLQAGADVNAKDDDGGTALMGAAFFGSEDIVEPLLQAGADVNAKDSNGRTALIEAAAAGHKGTVKLLLKAGAQKPIVVFRTKS